MTSFCFGIRTTRDTINSSELTGCRNFHINFIINIKVFALLFSAERFTSRVDVADGCVEENGFEILKG